jgi:hypothetical protein
MMFIAGALALAPTMSAVAAPARPVRAATQGADEDAAAGRPVLIGSGCIRTKPTLSHVLYVPTLPRCCADGCAAPLDSSILKLPRQPGHT